jgi:hypothetical protein
LEFTDVSEEHTVSIFRIQKEAMQVASKMQGQAKLAAYFLQLLFNPEIRDIVFT